MGMGVVPMVHCELKSQEILGEARMFMWHTCVFFVHLCMQICSAVYSFLSPEQFSQMTFCIINEEICLALKSLSNY